MRCSVLFGSLSSRARSPRPSRPCATTSSMTLSAACTPGERPAWTSGPDGGAGKTVGSGLVGRGGRRGGRPGAGMTVGSGIVGRGRLGGVPRVPWRVARATLPAEAFFRQNADPPEDRRSLPAVERVVERLALAHEALDGRRLRPLCRGGDRRSRGVAGRMAHGGLVLAGR